MESFPESSFGHIVSAGRHNRQRCFQLSAHLSFGIGASFFSTFLPKWCHIALRPVDLPHTTISPKTWGLFPTPSGSQIRLALPVHYYYDLLSLSRIRVLPQGGLARPLSKNCILFVFLSSPWADRPESSRHGTRIDGIH